MMQLANGQWALLAGNEQNDTTQPQCSGYQYRLAGVVAGGRIIARWCRIVR